MSSGRRGFLARLRRAPAEKGLGVGPALCWEDDVLNRLGSEQTFEAVYHSTEEPLAREAEAFLRGIEMRELLAEENSGLLAVETVEQLVATRRHKVCDLFPLDIRA